MTPALLALLAQAAPGVTLTPALLALGGLLVAALGAILGGGVAWGRFAATLEQLRADHTTLVAKVERATADGAQIAALQQSVADIRAEVAGLRQSRHDHGASLARHATLLDTLSSRVGHTEDDLRASRHPSPR